MRILIVDDEVGIRSLLYDVLSGEHDVSVLTNGRDALSVLSDPDHGFDIVLLDLNMPKSSGSNLVETLESYLTQDAQYIIITGYPEQGEWLRKYENVLDVMGKPFDIEALKKLLNNARASKKKSR